MNRVQKSYEGKRKIWEMEEIGSPNLVTFSRVSEEMQTADSTHSEPSQRLAMDSEVADVRHFDHSQLVNEFLRFRHMAGIWRTPNA
jgi:hypothetical protein